MIHFFMLFYILLLYEIYSCWFIMEINDDSQLLARIVEGPTKLIEAFFFFWTILGTLCIYAEFLLDGAPSSSTTSLFTDEFSLFIQNND